MTYPHPSIHQPHFTVDFFLTQLTTALPLFTKSSMLLKLFLLHKYLLTWHNSHHCYYIESIPLSLIFSTVGVDSGEYLSLPRPCHHCTPSLFTIHFYLLFPFRLLECWHTAIGLWGPMPAVNWSLGSLQGRLSDSETLHVPDAIGKNWKEKQTLIHFFNLSCWKI